MRILNFTLLLQFFCCTVIAQDKDKDWVGKNISITRHQLKLGTEVFSYTATTGYMEMKDEKDTLKANLFFIAYTKDGEADPAKRPILFSFNGGPGSASVWLHMGALGPKIVQMTDEGKICFGFGCLNLTGLDTLPHKNQPACKDLSGFSRPVNLTFTNRIQISLNLSIAGSNFKTD